ncbi:hypothetical protein [Chryseolinea lacunae]|uniref:Uncharacterized protein n=1 Tax=Chryseolinea lacunae TaxID=2801331 RepID=A0ABS1KZ40_9BACT|nr:hypothetical protein [Chryseolinea lacunae]MBL0743947.1 hypothetical protein [Chryseolinea lacunae]
MNLKAFFLLVFVGSMHQGFAQKKKPIDLYVISLTEHLSYLKSVQSPIVGYVEKTNETEGLPSQIGDIQLEYLTKSEIRAKTRGGKQIFLLVIRPVQV